ncbi:hypothetical protein GJA_2137 [Janthinobacterium agaricidamnosum NBRC 102515 = DSM 9628]|uniref:Uncharacterized protein n=1 Tax=Janthinobacterium agaricidamnosum NBRC 102515 = DSM 9628 TaxID=1349767 RepID=W0V676_9BURK|nr:hypothetical protein GJA_2137 [Janthinobacterium agaricidamnosum NBRC 102515 = DSM 9628]
MASNGTGDFPVPFFFAALQNGAPAGPAKFKISLTLQILRW